MRAVNDGGTSAWVQSEASVAPPCAVDNLSVVTSTPGEGDIGAAGGDITASWSAGKRASAYNLDYNGSQLESGLTTTSHSWSVGSRGTNDQVSVQSVNGNMTSPATGANVAWLTASGIKGTTATLDLAGHSGDWYVKQTAPTPAGSCESAGSGASHSLTGLTASTSHTFTAYSDSSCANSIARTTFTTGVAMPTLTSSAVGGTTATLTIGDHTGNWYYKADKHPHTSCSSAQSGTTASLTGLIPTETYTYAAYSDATCTDTNKLATVSAFTTGGVSVSNLASSSTGCNVGWFNGSKLQCALSFKTGTVEKAPNGYTLHSVTAKFIGNGLGSPTGFSVALYAADKTDPNNIKPAVNALATLSGDAPSVSIATTNTYACSGGECNLTANTDYFVVMSTNDTSNNFYQWQVSTLTGETLIPSNNEWSIGSNTLSGATWSGRENSVAHMKVAATVNESASLTASAISGTGATLTVANHAGDWFYKGISGTEASTTCVTVSGSTTKALSSLTADKLYGYTAYSGASCTGTEIGTEYFSTNDFDVGNLGEAASSGGSCLIGYHQTVGGTVQCAVAFDTGSRSGGYTLKSVTGRFRDDSNSPGNIVVKLHAADTGNSSNPAATAIANADFTGGNPRTAGLYSYACAGTGCALSKDTKYFVVMSTGDTSGSNYYRLTTTNSGNEAVHPTGTPGWEIANALRSKWGSNAWVNMAGNPTGLLHIAADD